MKGNLEAPPAAKTAASEAAVGSDAVAAEQKVFAERSRVNRVGTPPIIPQLPPKEWEKDGGTQAQETAPSSARTGKRGAPDKPFVLDWLL